MNPTKQTIQSANAFDASLSASTPQSFIEQYYAWLAVTVTVGIVLVTGIFLLWPQYQRMQNSGVLQHSIAEDRLAQEQAYLHDLQTMETNFAQLDKKSLRLLDTILPAEQSAARLFEEMELAFTDYGFSVQSINMIDLADNQIDVAAIVDNTTDTAAAQTESIQTNEQNTRIQPKNVRVIRVTINVTTDKIGYENFKLMLEFLEQYERVIDLETLSYSGAENGYTFVFNMYQRSIE